MVGVIASNRILGSVAPRGVARPCDGASSLALGGCAAVSAPGLNLDGPDLSGAVVVDPGRHHPQAGGQREATSRGSAPSAPSSASRAPSSSRPRRAASRCPRSVSTTGGSTRSNCCRNPARCYGEGARDVLIYVHGFNQTFETATIDAARLSQRRQLPRRHGGLLLAVQGQAARLWLRPRERDVVARCARAGADRLHPFAQHRPRSYRRAQRRHAR